MADDELAFFTQPEAAAVANPLAISACTADAASSTLGKPIDQLFWCAGSWGHLYPLSGHTLAFGSLAENTSVTTSEAFASVLVALFEEILTLLSSAEELSNVQLN